MAKKESQLPETEVTEESETAEPAEPMTEEEEAKALEEAEAAMLYGESHAKGTNVETAHAAETDSNEESQEEEQATDKGAETAVEEDDEQTEEEEQTGTQADKSEQVTKAQMRIFHNIVENALGDLRKENQRQFDKLNGKFGTLNRDLRKKLVSSQTLTDEDFAELQSEVGDDTAEVFKKLFSRAAFTLDDIEEGLADTSESEEATTDQDESRHETAEAAEDAEDIAALKRNLWLHQKHPGWEAKCQTEEFDVWLDTKSETERNAILDEIDGNRILENLESFDKWNEVRQKKEQQKQAKRRVLDDGEPATQGKGGGGSASKSQGEAEAALIYGQQKANGQA